MDISRDFIFPIEVFKIFLHNYEEINNTILQELYLTTEYNKYTSTKNLKWNHKLSRTHLMLRIMYNIGGTRNCNYIWSSKQSRWKDLNDKYIVFNFELIQSYYRCCN